MHTIRKAALADLDQIGQLFHDTITTINSRDYSPEQVGAWVSNSQDHAKWTRKLEQQYFLVAETNAQITGFSSMTDDYYVDFLFVHKDYQRKGIGYALLQELKQIAKSSGAKQMTADVSITARPFFESQGFTIVQEQSVFVKEILLTNFKMKLLL